MTTVHLNDYEVSEVWDVDAEAWKFMFVAGHRYASGSIKGKGKARVIFFLSPPTVESHAEKSLRWR